MAAEKARLEEEAWEWEHMLKVACQAEEARVRVQEEARKQEEEWHAQEEQDRLAVERDLHEEGGAFLGEGTVVTAFLAVVGFCWKSGGRGGDRGEGGWPLPGTRGRDGRRSLRRLGGR